MRWTVLSAALLWFLLIPPAVGQDAAAPDPGLLPDRSSAPDAAPAPTADPVTAAAPRTIHLLAPSPTYAKRYDPLLAEAAIRLAAMDLHRLGYDVRYWPLDRQSQMPPDAWPQVAISAKPLTDWTYLRLTRRGRQVQSLASHDGKDYRLLWEWDLDLDDQLLVGLLAVTDTDAAALKARLTDVRLNGEAVQGWQTDCLGGSAGRAVQDGGDWTLDVPPRTVNPEVIGSPEVGVFVHVPVRGDFVLDGRVASFEGKHWFNRVGLGCMDTLEPTTLVVAAYDTKPFCYTLTPQLGPSSAFWDDSLHVAGVKVRSEPGGTPHGKSAVVSFRDWDSLCSGTEALAAAIVSAVQRNTPAPAEVPDAPAEREHADASARQDPADPPTQQSTAEPYADLRERILAVDCGDIISIGHTLDGLVNAKQPDPRAHSLASLCGSILACQDLKGPFHYRARFLAGPLSHGLMARRLAGGKLDHPALRDQLWLQLATGFPDAALATIESIHAAPDDPELRAARLFITRDYRLLSAEDVPAATPLEQLGWVWAVQQCERPDLLGQVSQTLAQRRSPAFLAMQHLPWDPMGGQEQVCRLAMATDVRDLLNHGGLGQLSRREMMQALARATGNAVPDDSQESLDQLCSRTAESDRAMSAEVLVLVEQLYQTAARTCNGGPMAGVGCLPIEEVVDLKRGLLLHTLFNHVQHMYGVFSAPAKAAQFCADTAAGLDEPGKRYFELLRDQLVAHPAQPEEFNLFIDSEWTLCPGTLETIWQYWPESVEHQPARSNYFAMAPRGCWDLESFAKANRNALNPGRNAGMQCVKLDAYNGAVIDNLCTWAENFGWAQPAAQRMPYNAEMFANLSWLAECVSDYEAGLQAARQWCAVGSDKCPSQCAMFRLYRALGQTDQAIKLAREIGRSGDRSVGAANVLGTLAGMLAIRGQADEALQWGRQAAGSYSAAGLQGLAMALEANGKHAEALEVYAACAARYEGTADDYVLRLVRYGDPGQLEAIASRLVGEAADKVLVGRRVGHGLLTAGRPDLLERLYQGPLSFLPAATRLRCLMGEATRVRDFEAVLELSARLREIRPLEGKELIWTDLACRFTGDQRQRPAVRKDLMAMENDLDVGWYSRWARSGLSYQQAVKQFRHRLSPGPMLWMAGVDAELSGDLVKAVDFYRQAADYELDAGGTGFPRRWQLALEERTSSLCARHTTESQPADMPTPGPSGQ